ncbi:hypothetical protein ABW20_dc0107914 [Dactylellina cionopaga]|nr:hypothetical protein ABW20_dc0107914 [Dactylellina cionopaga]
MFAFLRPAARLARPRIYQIPTAPAPSILTRISQAQAGNRRLPTSIPYARPIHSTNPNFYNSRYQQAQYARTYIWKALSRWSSRPTFYLELAGLGGLSGGFYVYNIEEVPVSGRRRFNVISPQFESQLGDGQYNQIVKEYQNRILPERDPRVIQVRRVLERLIPQSGLPSNYDWKATVIDSPETNAFVIPGGKVFVFTGILPVCENDDGLAAVLGHEIGHNVARHIAEQMSRGIFLFAAAWVVEILWGIPGDLSHQLLQLAIDRPRSRAQESEADHIGLMMMARSCYDPKAAVALWQRMQIIEEKNPTPPELLSTHPSSHRRQVELETLLPQAYQAAMDSNCSETNRRLDQFQIFSEKFGS